MQPIWARQLGINWQTECISTRCNLPHELRNIEEYKLTGSEFTLCDGMLAFRLFFIGFGIRAARMH